MDASYYFFQGSEMLLVKQSENYYYYSLLENFRKYKLLEITLKKLTDFPGSKLYLGHWTEETCYIKACKIIY